ncbi:uncharacterized protein si:dkey-114l24.2 [Esox lucius]|uniref:uncharacterized protein si:dkey-114l24.2 n=1 Tax=Esox lucius TaxID=8010 RepID=UPI001476FA60|nr:uncharacterized protein si:dkey-114l24.2 [Esox lucius]
MMDTFLWLLCAATWLPGAPAICKAQTDQNKVASKNETNVLMYGMLQFGETLHQVSESIGTKMARIESWMRKQEAMLEKMGQEAGQAAEKEKQIRQVLGKLKGQMAGLQSEAEGAKDKLAWMEQEEGELRTTVINLETYLQNYSPNRIQELKERVSKHSSFLEGLQQWSQLQKQTIKKQNKHLRKLQKLSEALG